MSKPAERLWTIGHSTRSFEDFVSLLTRNGIETLVDVRTAPGSRRLPHFSKAALEPALAEKHVRYLHMPSLGGLRKPRSDSVNIAWRNDSFRGYADYMQQSEFPAALEELRGIARGSRTAIMCAEAVPWRCHRSLISDALTARGVQVLHILGSGEPKPHSLTPFAVVSGDGVVYPG